MTSKTKILFRADGNAKMGLGHIYRSLALANMLKNEYDCVFLIQNPSESIQQKIQEIASLFSLPISNEILEEAKFLVTDYLKGDEIVVLDGYHFKTAYQRMIKSTGVKLVCIDDIYSYHFVADAIINHAGGLNEDVYSKETYTKCYLGLEYALLQAPYLEVAKGKRYQKQEPNRIFICLGGADPNNDTIRVLKEIEERSPTAKLYVVLGGSYSYDADFDAFVEESKLTIQKLSNLSAEEMIDYMQRSEIMISSPSTVSYECLSVGGILYLYMIADNQRSILKYFKEAGLAFDFIQDYPIVDIVNKKKAMKLQENLLNGQSEQRLLNLFKQL